MENRRCQCVFPSPSEEELLTIPGATPGTAIRALMEPGAGGYVRLQQLAHDPGLGWYVQKSFVIPGEMLSVLITQLRKADCLIPRRPASVAGPAASPFMRLAPSTDLPAEPPLARRRGA